MTPSVPRQAPFKRKPGECAIARASDRPTTSMATKKAEAAQIAGAEGEGYEPPSFDFNGAEFPRPRVEHVEPTTVQARRVRPPYATARPPMQRLLPRPTLPMAGAIIARTEGSSSTSRRTRSYDESGFPTGRKLWLSLVVARQESNSQIACSSFFGASRSTLASRRKPAPASQLRAVLQLHEQLPVRRFRDEDQGRNAVRQPGRRQERRTGRQPR